MVKVLTVIKLTLRAFVFENGCIIAVLLEIYKLLRFQTAFCGKST